MENLDSKKQENQEKQTGSPDEWCEKHQCKKDYGRCDKYHLKVCEKCEEEEEQKAKVRKMHSILGLPPRLKECSFKKYKPSCESAKKILKECMDYASGIAVYKNSMTMLGGVGTGKTHLAVSICKKVCDLGYEAKITTISEIIRDIRATWNNKTRVDDWGVKYEPETENQVIERYSNVFMLVIDEIGSQYGSDSEKIIISEIINNRYNNILPTIIIGNITMSEAQDYMGARVIDRLKDAGKILVFDWKSYRKPQ